MTALVCVTFGPQMADELFPGEGVVRVIGQESQEGDAPGQIGTPTTFAQSAAQAHTGTNSWRIVADASGEGAYRFIPGIAQNKFYSVSCWVYVVSGTVQVLSTNNAKLKLSTQSVTGASWQRYVDIGRSVTGEAAGLFIKSTGGAAEWHVDDVEIIELSPITLTVTPASEANSREEMAGTPWGTYDTLRIDGTDSLVFPTADLLQAARGSIAKWTRLRHATAWADEIVLDAGGASPNAFSIRRLAATNVLHVYYGDQNDASTATIADANWHMVSMSWANGICYLYIDGAAAAGFALIGAAIPTLNANLYLGSAVAGTNQQDGADLGVLISNSVWPAGKHLQLYNLPRPWIVADG